MITLNADNYYSKEADRDYFSASQIKSLASCEARALAELNGTYKRPDSSALLIGSYVDCALTEPDKLNQFAAEHPEIYKRDGTIKAEFAHANDMIDRATQDKVFMEYLSGEHQKIVTGSIFGFPFKAKFDSYKAGQRITDLKTVKDLEPLYKPGEGRLSVVEFWAWDLQMAIYAALEGNDLPTYLAIITKQTPPDLLLVEVEQHRREACLEVLKDKLPRYDAIKHGIIEPTRCEHCDYCRATRKITEPIKMDAWEAFQFE